MKLSYLQNNLVIFISIIISILISTLLWDKITLPLNNITGAKGALTEIGYNPNTKNPSEFINKLILDLI